MERSWQSCLWYDTAYWIARLGLTLGFSMRTEGWQHVPSSGPALLLANHQSFLDPVAVGVAAKRRIRYLARKTLFRNRYFGGLLESLGAVSVDQEGVAKEGLRAVLKMLEAGEAVLIFPEGERCWTGAMQPLKPGVLLMLKRLTFPIVPVGVAGAFDAFPRTSHWPRLSPLLLPAAEKGTIAVSVGKPFSSARYNKMSREETLGDLFEEISRSQQRAEKLRLKPVQESFPQ